MRCIRCEVIFARALKIGNCFLNKRVCIIVGDFNDRVVINENEEGRAALSLIGFIVTFVTPLP